MWFLHLWTHLFRFWLKKITDSNDISLAVECRSGWFLINRKETENHPMAPIRWRQYRFRHFRKELRWQSKPFNLSKLRITNISSRSSREHVQIFSCSQMSPVVVYGLGAKILPDLQRRWQLARKCFRWQPESFELFLIHQDVLDSHYLYCVRFHLIQTPELPAKNTHDQSYWTCRKIGGWDLDSVTSKVETTSERLSWTSISWATKRI